ncbi:hypothetical protein ACF0H5_011490 [Mactra antiquata]
MSYFYIFLLFIFIACAACERTKEKIYINIDEGKRSPCFRRFNGTHQIGCSSAPKGNVGVVHYVNSESDLNWLIDTGPHKPYSVLLNPADFNMAVVKHLLDSGKVNGIMVIQVEGHDDEFAPAISFSPDKACPNDASSMYKNSTDYGSCSKVDWNPVGESLMFQDLGIPIFVFTNYDDVKTTLIEKCYKQFNEPDATGSPRDYPLCAVELKDRMDGAVDSETCIRRTNHQMNLKPSRYCDPMGDRNVHGSLKPVMKNETRKDNSVILVVARMDSFSMFDNHYPSADNHVSGIVALLAISEAIGRIKENITKSDNTKDILFVFFQGEAFDYIGSGRMVEDMIRNQFPSSEGSQYLKQINLDHISHIIEVNQLAFRDNGKVWIHTDPISRSKLPQVDDMVESLKNIGEQLFDESEQDLPLPPASAQSFLKKKSIPTVVVTEHKKQYVNKYYNSRLDLAAEIKVSCDNKTSIDCYNEVSDQAKNLSEVADSIAKFVYKLATGNNASKDLYVDPNTVHHLLYCYLISPQCELFNQSLKSDRAKQLDSKPYPFYVGVDSQVNNYTALTYQMLVRYLGDKVENYTQSQCDKSDGMYKMEWMQGPYDMKHVNRTGFCIKALVNLSLAESYAFELENYDFKSGEFATWTESSWAIDAMNVRIFLIPSKNLEITTLVVGIVILVLSLVGGYIMNKGASKVFESSTPDSSMAPVAL